MKKWRSVVALILVGLMVLGMLTTIIFSLHAYGDPAVSDMQNELDDIIAKREKLEAELSALKDKKEAALEQKAIIDQQINDLNREAELLDDLVGNLSAELEESQAKLDEAQDMLDTNTKLAKERIRAMYELSLIHISSALL